MLVGLKEVTRAMAPDQNWRWLQDLCNRLGRTAKPSKDKAKRIRSSIEIYEAAFKGLSDLADGPLDLKHCLVYRDHLMLAFLTARPPVTTNGQSNCTRTWPSSIATRSQICSPC